MPAISSIPEEYKGGFRDIFLLGENDFNSIVEGLNSIPLTSSIKKLAVAATKFKPSIHDDVANMFVSIGSLTSLIEKGASIEEISHDICIALSDELQAAIESSDKVIVDNINEDLKGILGEAGKQRLIERLSILLKTERLYYAAKANNLMYEYQNVFIQAKLASDIRPIFNIDIEKAPIAGLIIHSLHIHYKADRESEHRDIFIALDSEDLQSLKETLIRAEKKQKSLGSIFKNSGIEHING